MTRLVALILIASFLFSGTITAQAPKGGIAPTPQAAPSVASKIAILNVCARNGELATEVVAFRQVLDALGIAYVVTPNVQDASKYGLVLVAGSLWNATLSAREFNDLSTYVESGGALVASGGQGSKYQPLFGIGAQVDSRKRFAMHFEAPATDPSLAYLDHPEERTISLGNRKLYPETIWTRSFETDTALSLAVTDDGLSIFSVNGYGKGSAYALGVTFSEAVLLPMVGGDYEAQRVWVNGFEPGADVFMLILKGIHESAFAPYAYLSAIPRGKKTALLLSHDVDAQDSFRNSIEYAEMERRHGVRSTFFITTKTFKDESDIAYYNAERIGYLKKVRELGGDIGSHSVSHSRRFETFPLGKSIGEIAQYSPSSAPTVMGEVFVSKRLLDRDFEGQDTLSFRAGELRIPKGLAGALERSGYRIDSSFSANDIMINYPYRLLDGMTVAADVSGIVEIPVTFDDSQGYLTETNMHSMLKTWIDVIGANADNGAISVLLIHPSVAGYKLKTEDLLLTALADEDIWIGDMTSYGEFWLKRASVRYDISETESKVSLRLQGRTIPPGVCIVVGKVPRTKAIEVLASDGTRIDCLKTVKGDRVYLESR